MRLVYGVSSEWDGLEIGKWAASKIPHMDLKSLGAFTAFGIIDNTGQMRGAALYHGYSPFYRGIEISFALDSPRFLTAPVIAGILSYPVTQLNCLRITSATPKSSASARRFLEKFGFKREGVARCGFGEFGDAVIYGLTRKDWDESWFNRRGTRCDRAEYQALSRRLRQTQRPPSETKRPPQIAAE